MKTLARFRRSRIGVVLHFLAICGMILQPVPLARSYWADSNGDGVKEWVDDPPQGDSWWDEDGDGDGWANGFEAVYGSDPYRLDSDFDGITDKDEYDLLPLNDPWHWDSDGDGYSDYDEYYNELQGTPLSVDYASLMGSSQPFYSTYDADGDGMHNPWDSEPVGFDRDGDGLLNWEDGYMDDPNNGNSPPPEGPPPDSDADGMPDDSDPYPYGSYWYNGAEYGGSWIDTDADGIPDPADSFPEGSYWYNGTEYPGVWSDQDNDGVPDVDDPFPYQSGSYWYNGTEYGGEWMDGDGDGIPDPADPLPYDYWNGEPHYSYNGTEYPGEFVDRDGDTVPDPADSWPDDPENGADDDNDGLSNYEERTAHHTDPNDVDSDNDYLTDYEELYIYKSMPAFAAIDPNDPHSLSDSSVLDYFEVGAGLGWADVDGDGLPDRVEEYYADLGHGLDKNNPADAFGDLDGDGLTNLFAYQHGFDLVANLSEYDSDRDQITNAQEDYWNQVRPGILNKNRFIDAIEDPDHDGLFNFEEVQFNLDPGNANTFVDNTEIEFWGDVDDGTGNITFGIQYAQDGTDFEAVYQSYRHGVVSGAPSPPADPFPIMAPVSIADWDGDGMPNWWEHYHSLTLRDNTIVDTDSDGLNNLAEYGHGTNPRLSDSDGDGWSDSAEVAANTNPAGRYSHPQGSQTTPPTAESAPPALSPGTVGIKPTAVVRGDWTPMPPIETVISGSRETTTFEEHFRKTTTWTEIAYFDDWGYWRTDILNWYEWPEQNIGNDTFGPISEPLTIGLPIEVSSFETYDWRLDDTEVTQEPDPAAMIEHFGGFLHDNDDDENGDPVPCVHEWYWYTWEADFAEIVETTDVTTHVKESASVKLRAEAAVPTSVAYTFRKQTFTLNSDGTEGACTSTEDFDVIIEVGEIESSEWTFSPSTGEKIRVEFVSQRQFEQSGSDAVTATVSDASGPQYRRISLMGFPIADSPPAIRPDAREEVEETYIDALGLELRQSVADLRVPVASSLLNLEVKRELIHDAWTEMGGLHPAERPDRPFGVSWRSNLAACVQITDEKEAVVVDETGATQSFVRHGSQWVQTIAESNFSKVRQNRLTIDSEGGATTATYTKRNGTVCTYQGAGLNQTILSGADVTPIRWLRLTQAVDRWGNRLVYEYPGPGTLIPSVIYRAGQPDQRLSIRQDTHGHVVAVQGPDGVRVDYSYANCRREVGDFETAEHYLESASRAESAVHYLFKIRSEADPTPIPDDVNSVAFPYQHPLLKRFEDANGNSYQFEYVFNSAGPPPKVEYVDMRFELDEKGEVKQDTITHYDRAQLGLPPLVASVSLPNGLSAVFSCDKHIRVSKSPNVANWTAASSAIAVDGSQYEWSFSQPGVFMNSQAWPIDEAADVLQRQLTLFFEKLTITSPLGSEEYEFDFGADMAVTSVKDMSGNVTTYEYGMATEDPEDGPTPFPTRVVLAMDGTRRENIGYASDQPTAVIDALNRRTTFEYAEDSLELQATTTPAGVRTDYGLKPGSGLREWKKVFAPDGVLVQHTEYAYSSASFPGFVTKETIKALPGDPPGNRVTDFIADAYGRQREMRQSLGNGQMIKTQFGYDLANRKRWEIDPNGGLTEWRYDTVGRLMKLLPPNCGDGQKAVSYAYDPAGNLIRETNENGVPTFHAYDSLHRKVSTTVDLNRDGVAGTRTEDLVTSWTYNAMNLIETIKDPRGIVARKTYDAIGRLQTETTAFGLGAGVEATTSYEYGTNSGGSVFDRSGFKPTRKVDPRGVETVVVYDKLCRPTSTTVTDGGTTTTEYDAAGNPWRGTDPLSKTTTTTFDALNRPTQVLYADGRTTKTAYSSAGLVLETEDELGRTTNFSYDAAGRKTSMKAPETNDGYGQRKRPETKYGYDLAGNVVSVTDPLGNVTTTQYDARNRPVRVMSPAVYDPVTGLAVRPTTTTAYDGVGNKIRTTDPMWNATDMVYDAANRVVAVTGPPVPVAGVAELQRPVTTTYYDANGNVAVVTDPNGVTTFNNYDPHNRLANTTDGAGIMVQFEYDKAGNRNRVIDGKENSTTFTYDGLNRLLTETTPGGLIVSNAYNALNKTSRTDGNGQVTTYAYDNRHRLLSMTYAGSGKARSYTYDAAGRITSVTESDAPGAAVGYGYDELGRVVSETSQGIVHVRSYDLAGHELVRRNLGTARQVERSYDAGGRIVTVSEGGRQTWLYYDLAGRVVARRMGNGTWAGLNYDALGRVLISTTYQNAGQQAGQILFEHEWDYDLAGNVREQRESWPGAPERAAGTRITSMEYDGAYRLTQESITEPGGAMTVTSYSYDAANNRTEKTVVGGEEPGSWTYTSNALNQLTGIVRQSGATGPASVSYSYDANGNRISRIADGATDTCTWDAENRLVEVNKAGTIHRYQYDYRTRRISREEPQSGTGLPPVKTAVVFAGGLSVAEYETANGVISNPAAPAVEYIRGPDLGGGVGGMLYSLRAEGGATGPVAAKYSYPNGRGDVVAQADQSCAVTWTASYEAFGTHKKETGTNLDRQRANTKEEDPTGLLNEGFRYRDLETGTWLSRDPAGFVDGPNLYGYVRCNPWTKFDPKGLWESDGHYYPTYILGRLNGMNNGSAMDRAYYAQYPDQVSSYDARDAGFRLVGGRDKEPEDRVFDLNVQRVLHTLDGKDKQGVADQQDRLVSHLRDHGSEMSAAESGLMTHMLGDNIAHTKPDGSHYRAPFGHGKEGGRPDDPANHPEKFRAYLDALNDSMGGKATKEQLDAISKSLTTPVGDKDPETGTIINHDRDQAKKNARKLAESYGLSEHSFNPDSSNNSGGRTSGNYRDVSKDDMKQFIDKAKEVTDPK